MRDKFWLFIVVGKAALITTLGDFVLGVLGSKIATPGVRGILAVSMVFLPAGIAEWWMFGTLQAYCTRRESRAVTTAFAVFAPVSFGIAMLFGELSGGYAAFLGSLFGLVGASVGIFVMTTVVNFVLCHLTLRITRNIVRLESTP
jgi:hypothetical protein